jgi:hypothetical protein
MTVPAFGLVMAMAASVASAGLEPTTTLVQAPPPPRLEWLFDRQSHCYVLHTGFAVVDRVTWAGACLDGAAAGAGAALFTYRDGFAEFVSGNFVRGAVEGRVRISLPNGGEFAGLTHFGKLTGSGTVTFHDSEDVGFRSGPPSNAGATTAGVDRVTVDSQPGADGGSGKKIEPLSSRSAPPEKRGSRLAAANLLESQPIPVRQSEVHAIDSAAVPFSEEAKIVSRERPEVIDSRVPSDCLSVESDDEKVGFFNRCAFGVRFSYCVANSTRADVDACGQGSDAGEVLAQSFAALFSAFGQPDYDVRWVACDARAQNAVPRMVRVEPPAGQCLPRQIAARH